MIHRSAAFLALVGLLVCASANGEDETPKPSKTFVQMTLGMKIPMVTSVDDLEKNVGRVVALRGVVSQAPQTEILGVEVRSADVLRGHEAYAVGILAKSTASKDARAGDAPAVQYHLYFDLAGKLSEARLTK